MIRSFADKRTEQVWNRERVRALPPGVQRIGHRKLEQLKGDRAGTYSIRIDRQWRICFRWTENGPEGVAIVDYHN